MNLDYEREYLIVATYIALIRKERGTDYGVNFPDLPGLAMAGRTLAEALEFAREALAGHIDVMAEHGDPIPAPSDVDAVMRDLENRDAVAALVEAPAPKGRHA